MGNKKSEKSEKGFFQTNIFGNNNKKKFPDIMESIMRENNISSSKLLTNEEKIKINVEFIEAIRNKNYDLMVECFNKGADINSKIFTKNYHIEGATPIFYAIKYYDEKIFNFLVRNGADVNVKDKEGNCPIIYLIGWIMGSYTEKNCEDIKNKLYGSIKLLLENDAEVNILNNKEKNVLSYTLDVIPFNNCFSIEEEDDEIKFNMMKKVSEDVLNLLIDNGADFNIKDKEGVTPLMKIIKLNSNIDINLEVFEKILEKEIDVNICDNNKKTALHYAMEKGRFENGGKLIKLLIEKGADVNVQDNEGNTPLILATKNYDVELIKLLVEKGANVNVSSNDRTVPFILIVKKLDMELVELFIKKGVWMWDCDNKGRRALHYVMDNNSQIYEKFIKLLIEKGADVNVQDSDGVSPLMLAVKHLNIERIKLLRKNGAKVDFKEKEKGWDALHYAILSEKIEIVKNLLEINLRSDFSWRGRNEKGILWCQEKMEEPPFTNKNHTTLCNDKGYILQDKNGNTHLMIALETKNQEIIKLVFEKCYNEKHFYIKNNLGQNILHKAVFHENKEMVELLISKKMNLNEQNDMFHTPLMDACNRIYDKNTSEIAKLLIDAGADITFVNERNESALSILSKTIMQRINGSEWKFNQEIFEVYEILNKKIKEIAEYRKTHDEPDEEFIKKNSGENDLPF